MAVSGGWVETLDDDSQNSRRESEKQSLTRGVMAEIQYPSIQRNSELVQWVDISGDLMRKRKGG